jgi:hypothetical protein
MQNIKKKKKQKKQNKQTGPGFIPPRPSPMP